MARISRKNVYIEIARPADTRAGTPQGILARVKAYREDANVSIGEVDGVPVFGTERRYTVSADREFPRASVFDTALFGGSLFGAPVFGGGEIAGGTVRMGSHARANYQAVDARDGETFRIKGTTLDAARKALKLHCRREGNPR